MRCWVQTVAFFVGAAVFVLALVGLVCTVEARAAGQRLSGMPEAAFVLAAFLGSSIVFLTVSVGAP